MQAELGLLQQAVEIHGLVLAFHWSWGGLVCAAIWGWQGQQDGQEGGISVLSASRGGKLSHSRALLTALLLHSQAGHRGDGDRELGQRGCSQAQLGRAHTTDIYCQG